MGKNEEMPESPDSNYFGGFDATSRPQANNQKKKEKNKVICVQKLANGTRCVFAHGRGKDGWSSDWPREKNIIQRHRLPRQAEGPATLRSLFKKMSSDAIPRWSLSVLWGQGVGG
jgi:hypothetical protein